MSISEEQGTPLRYGIGVDTGGTFTDAVLVDLATARVLKTAKRPTTTHDLSVGIAQALEVILEGVEENRVTRVALSTTLATNALVENRGADVGLLVIGPMKHLDLPVISTKYLDGGHDHTGRESMPLNLEALMASIVEFRGHVDTYAVCASFSIENPNHELVAAKAIELVDPRPVFLSHQVSDRAGMRERAATTALHARLMPVIRAFTREVRSLMEEKHITATVSVIRGDATPEDPARAENRAAETIASGPAATARFGASAIGGRALVVDVGGTTTDITLVENGRPAISNEGSLIGPWRTHVQAVDMMTVGIGGDSHVVLFQDGRLTIGPARVIPLALAGDIPDPEEWLGPERRGKCLFLRPGETDRDEDDLLIAQLRRGASTPRILSEKLGIPELTLEREIASALFHRQILETGFTPTDALRVLGRIDIGNVEASLAGARILAKARSQEVEQFCRAVVRETVVSIRNAIARYVFRHQTGLDMPGYLLGEHPSPLMATRFSLNLPIVGVGAAAHELLPEVAEELNTAIVFPPHYEVGNAVGAILVALDIRE